MIKRLVIAILLCAAPVFSQVPFGGPQAPPPPTDQQGANQAPNGGTFATCSSTFTACGWATNPACGSIDTATSPPGESTGSAKFVNCGTNNVTVLEASNVALGGHDAIGVWMKVHTDSSWNGTGVGVVMFDNQHGGGSGPGFCCSRQNVPVTTVAGNADSNVGTSQGFQNYYFEIPVSPAHLFDTNLQMRVNIGNETAGTLWVADVVIAPVWRAMRSFMLYPGYRGYLWSDLTPPKRYTQIQPVSAGSPYYNFFMTGSATVAGEIAGVSEVQPPNGDTLSQLTLVVKLASVAGCASGVIATPFNGVPQSVQPWQILPSAYGSLTTGTKYFICSSLYLTSGMTLIDSDVDWGIVPETTAFRNGLYNWYDANAMWEHNQVPTILHGSYDRYDSTRGLGIPTTLTQATLNYAGNAPVGGIVFPQATGSPSPTHDSLAYDYRHQGLNDIIDFAQYSAVNPDNLAPPSDELTVRLNLFSNAALTHDQDFSLFYGCVTTGTATCTAPTFSPTVTTGTTTTGITSNFLFLAWVDAAGPIPVGNSPGRQNQMTLPSAITTVNLSAAGCAGVNCTAQFVSPSCTASPTFQVGGYLYAAIGSTSTPPAITTFSKQYPTFTGAGIDGAAGTIPCGSTVTLTTFDPSTLAPPTSDTTAGTQPSWRGVASICNGGTCPSSDTAIYALFNNVMCSNSFPNATGGYYIGDEYSLAAAPTVFYMTQILNAGCAGTPTTGLDIADGYWRLNCRIFDRCGSDPYGSLNNAGPNEYITGEGIPRNRANFYNTFNAPNTSTSYPSRTDMYADAVCRGMYGSRPSWIVIRQFGATNLNGFNYQEMQQNLWKALIGCWKYGDEGAGVMTWGQVGSTGLEATVYVHGDSQAYFDTVKSSNEVRDLDPVSVEPILDTSVLSATTGAVDGTIGLQLTSSQVISNIKITTTAGAATTVAAQCNIQAGQTSLYSNATNWPFGPVEFVTRNYTPSNTALVDGYIYSTNVCDSPFNVTFSFPVVPAATIVLVLNEGRTLPITTSGCPNSQPACFTDTWASMDVHIYAIQQPRGAVIH